MLYTLGGGLAGMLTSYLIAKYRGMKFKTFFGNKGIGYNFVMKGTMIGASLGFGCDVARLSNRSLY